MEPEFAPNAQPVYDHARRQIEAEPVAVPLTTLVECVNQLGWSYRDEADGSVVLLGTDGGADVTFREGRLRLAPAFAIGRQTLGRTWHLERLVDGDRWISGFEGLTQAQFIALLQGLCTALDCQRASAPISVQLRALPMPDAEADSRGLTRGTCWYEIAAQGVRPQAEHRSRPTWMQ